MSIDREFNLQMDEWIYTNRKILPPDRKACESLYATAHRDGRNSTLPQFPTERIEPKVLEVSREHS